MIKLISILALIFTGTCQPVFASPPIIWSHPYSIDLQSGICMTTTGACFISGTVDPSLVATTGNTGSLFINSTTGALYIKQDNGLTTNWLPAGAGTVSSVGLSDASTTPIYSISGSPVTSGGTLSFTLKTEAKNTVFSGPSSGANAQPGFRALVGADLPNPSASTLGGIESLASSASHWINAISTSGVPSSTQPAFTDISGSVAASQMPAFTGDVTTSAGAVATTVAKIQGTTVSGTTGSTNVMFSASPTTTGTFTAAAANFSGNVVNSGTTTLKNVTNTIYRAVSTASSGLDLFFDFNDVSSAQAHYADISPYISVNTAGAQSGGLDLFTYNAGSAVRGIRINPDGKVSVGNTNDTYNLDVTGTARITSDATISGTANTGNLNATGTGSFTENTVNGAGITVTNSSSGSYVTIQPNGATGSGITDWPNSTVIESVPASTGGLVLGSYSGSIYFQTNNRTLIPLTLDASGNTTATGTVSVTTNSAAPNQGRFNLNIDTGSTAISAITSYNAGAPQLIGYRTGGTVASPSALGSGSTILAVSARGYGATGFASANRAQIAELTSEAWSDTAQGTKITFSTTPNGTATQGVAVTINNDKSTTFSNFLDANYADPLMAFTDTTASTGKKWELRNGVAAASTFDLIDVTDSKTAFTADSTGAITFPNSTIIGTAALSTSATDGFLYMDSCAGTPTGTPTSLTGRNAMVWDSTNNSLYVYSGGAWNSALTSRAMAAKTANYTLTTLNRTVTFSGMSSDQTATLPTAVGVSGTRYTIINLDTAHTVAVATTSAQTIGGRASSDIVLSAGRGDNITVESDGSNWQIISKRETKVLTSATSGTDSTGGSAFVTTGCTVTLTPGTWRISGTFAAATTTTSSYITLYGASGVYAADGANTSSTPTAVSGNLGFTTMGGGTFQAVGTATGGGNLMATLPPFELTVTSNTPIYMVPELSFFSGTINWNAQIQAARVW